jgi:hypothetical protein
LELETPLAGTSAVLEKLLLPPPEGLKPKFDLTVCEEFNLKSLHFNLWPAFQSASWHLCELGNRKQEQPYDLC